MGDLSAKKGIQTTSEIRRVFQTLRETRDADNAVKHGQLGKSVEDLIAGAVVERLLTPGAHLQEIPIATELGVSRTPVREALQRLAARRLVDLSPRAGAYVTELDPVDVAEVYLCRSELYKLVVEQVANLATDEEIEDLSYLERKTRALAGVNSDKLYFQLNLEVHQKLVSLSGSRRYAELLNSLEDTTLRLRFILLSVPDAVEESASRHSELVELVASRKPEEAGIVMRSLIRAAGRHVLEGYFGQHLQNDSGWRDSPAVKEILKS